MAAGVTGAVGVSVGGEAGGSGVAGVGAGVAGSSAGWAHNGLAAESVAAKLSEGSFKERIMCSGIVCRTCDNLDVALAWGACYPTAALAV